MHTHTHTNTRTHAHVYTPLRNCHSSVYSSFSYLPPSPFHFILSPLTTFPVLIFSFFSFSPPTHALSLSLPLPPFLPLSSSLSLSPISSLSCMYISGMPGVGKTALVREVARYLRGSVEEDMLPPFKFVEVNGMKVTGPPKIFVSIVMVRALVW